MTSSRLPTGGAVERTAPVNFTFDGKPMTGLAGDTLASALLANGRLLVGRGFKYHRPRGILTAGAAEPNALVTIGRGGRTEPNTRATVQELYEGLEARSQNRWPSLERDIGAVNGLVSPFLSAGFYYKTFMWPKGFWEKVYEPLIRRAAGLGRATYEADPDGYEKSWAHCDLLVVGAGPAGLAAALAAARAGARVVLADEGTALGGSLLAETARIGGVPAAVFAREIAAELASFANVRVLTRTTVFGWYDSNVFGAVERVQKHVAVPDPHRPVERLWRIVAKAAILATGAEERPLVFGGNDRPGVMMAGAMRAYLNRWSVAPGRRVGIFSNTDAGYALAADLEAAGVEVAAIVDPRPQRAEWLGRARVIRGVVAGTSGRQALRGMIVRRESGDEHVAVDALAMSGGFNPVIALACHRGARPIWSEERAAFLAPEVEGVLPAGAAAGVAGLADCLADGGRAAERLGYAPADLGVVEGAGGTGQGAPIWAVAEPKGKAFVDFQNDVHLKDLKLAKAEGYGHVELAKRYTTNGMATDQGKMSNVNGLMIAADALGKTPPQVGLTTFRPPYTPTTFGAFAGYHQDATFEVTRKTPIDPWADAHGAVFEPVALWRRAWYFPRAGEDMHAAVSRECRAVRASVGIFDASTLGKIEVTGPDAVTFMERMYTNPWAKLGVGRCRYGLLLGEDGFIRDDGVIGRLAQDRFHVTTTTGGAARVLNMMEDYLQTEWPDLRVWLTSTTEQWAVVALQGPNARKLLEPFVEGLDISEAAFPHMAAAECTVAGFPARLFRVSFTGELGFEVNVPARHGRALWEKLWEAGQKLDICAYGTETMHVLRAEKGYIIVGQDTDGTLTPDDANLNWAVGKAKPDFVGKRSLIRPDMVAKGRKQLVGLLTDDPAVVLEEGAQIVADPNQPKPMTMLGHVTSSYWSDALGRSIAMAVVADGREREGQTLHIPMPDRTITAKVVKSTVFYDPENTRISA